MCCADLPASCVPLTPLALWGPRWLSHLPGKTKTSASAPGVLARKQQGRAEVEVPKFWGEVAVCQPSGGLMLGPHWGHEDALRGHWPLPSVDLGFQS